MSLEKRIFEGVPKGISKHSEKIIVAFILFTLVMGYFASNLDMEADKDSFYPETEKTDNLDYIEDNFGGTEGLVQIVHEADEGDVLTAEVLEDISSSEEEIKNSEIIKETLESSEEAPDGTMTLIDIILKADTALAIEESLMEMENQTEGMKNQTELYRERYQKLNDSLALGNKLLQAPFVQIVENTTRSYHGMSKIFTEPYRWEVVEKHQVRFQNLIQILADEETRLDEKISATEDLIAELSGREAFVDLLEGMKNIHEFSKDLPEEEREQVSQVSTGMVLQFLSIPESMPDDEQDFEFEDLPSLSLSEDEKKERLQEMDDLDIKETVHDVVNHRPEELNESIDETLKNIDGMQEEIEKSNRTLNEVNRTLDSVETEDHILKEALNRFEGSLEENRTVLDERIQYIESERSDLEYADQLGSEIEMLEDGLKTMLSSDFDEDAGVSQLSAENSLSLVQMDTSLSTDKRLEAQDEVIDIAKEESEASSIRVSADQVMMDQVNDSAAYNLYVLLPISFAYVIVVLMIVYRSVMESLFSLLSLVMAVVWTFGAGVLLGYQFNPMIIAVPILMTGLTIDYGILMILRIREEKDDGKNIKRSIITATISVGGAIVLATTTSSIGFSSKTLSGLEVMRNFGVLATIGMISSFFLFVLFLPAVLQKVEGWREKREQDQKEKKSERRAKKKKAKRKGKNIVTRFLSTSTVISNRRPKLVLIIVILLTLGSGVAAVQVETTFDMQDFLPEDRSQYQNIEYVQSNFDLNQTDAYILMEGDLNDPDYLRALNKTQNNLEEKESVLTGEGLSSPLTVLQRYGTAMPMSPEYNETIVTRFDESVSDEDQIPNENVSELYDLLFKVPESQESIENVLEEDYTSAVLKVRENSDKIDEDLDNAEDMEKELLDAATPLEEEGYEIGVTSSSIIDHETVTDLSSTQLESLVISIIIVGIFLTLIFYYLHRSLVLGLITTFPVSLVTIWLLGFIVLIDIPLNFMTITVTALTVGLGVHYSIQVTHRFVEESEKQNSVYEAIRTTIKHIGSAHLGALFTTVGALGILATSNILPLSQFGYITAIAIAFSFLVSVFVLPSALVLWARYNKG